jgi:hypothetical protein
MMPKITKPQVKGKGKVNPAVRLTMDFASNASTNRIGTQRIFAQFKSMRSLI